jgi:hypothetical protein
MKEYPLEVYEMSEYGFYSKGIHDEDKFLDAIKKDYGVEDVSKYHVVYEWVRMRPALPLEREEYGCCSFFADAKQGQRGAFPITITY